MHESHVALRSGASCALLFVALQCLTIPAGATPLDSFLRADYKGAYDQYLILAKGGSSNAQAMLGAMLQDGIGVDVSVEQAAVWFEKGAEAGNSVAQNGLGYMHDKGRGMGIDFSSAFKLYQSSAEKGFPRAKFNLGIMYDLGQGVARSHEQAFKWYLSAAQNGFVSAQNSVGGMYALGEGVKKDDAQALYWLRLAATFGHDVLALGNLGALYAMGAGVEKDPKTAIAFYEKAAAAKDSNADFNLGLMYLKGDGVSKDLPRAVKLFQQAAAHGSARASAAMGLMYATGFGVGKANPMQAVTLLLTAANSADQAESKVCDIKTAASLDAARKLAQSNDAEAQYCLGVLYGQGVSGLAAADPAQAAQFLQAAAQQGNSAAQYRVGVTAMQKAASPWESKEAIHWFLASALHQLPNNTPDTAEAAQAFLEKSDPSIAFSMETTPTSARDLLPGQMLEAMATASAKPLAAKPAATAAASSAAKPADTAAAGQSAPASADQKS